MTPRLASFLRVGGKFIIHDEAVDYLHFAKVMSSLKETPDLLLVSCVKGIINAKEFAILYHVNMSKNPLFRTTTMKNSHWTISAKKSVLQNFVLRKMIYPFGRFLWNSTCFPLLAEVCVCRNGRLVYVA